MNAQDLKNSILQLAIQGKLVEQREEEGTAKELIEKIKTDKEKLIKEKRIKKEKPLPEIIEDEIPFDIPGNWEWVRLGDCCLYSFSGRSPKYTKIPNDNIAIGQRNNQTMFLRELLSGYLFLAQKSKVKIHILIFHFLSSMAYRKMRL